ncbi:insulin-like growth factor 2 mRNA-binding protein 1 [Galendromus occidentalis]|uniref:Insulin-like growth factor 2 mRNA-binding protein 1 n=1 Tax=Galendromus occidentalis TaxID=34638 RepID=A0AAJ7WHR9_9ACAR|nr:insulin-like growth factor 2 mRNA-binding protein 1 [Galendromus occidentalis]
MITCNIDVNDGIVNEAIGTLRGRPQGTCKVLVSRISANTNKKEIHSLLSTFGNIISCEVRQNQDKDRSAYYRLLVTFEATEQAQQAVRNLSNYRYGGSFLRLEYYNPNFGDMNGGPNPHHIKNFRRHNGHMAGRGNTGMPNGGHAGDHGGHVGGHRGSGGSMMNGGHMNGSMRSPMAGPGGYYSGHVGHPPPKELPVRMLVPSEMVGAIIGKSGATITSITQQSQAKVEVNKKNAGGIFADGQVDKVINIHGTNEACSQACKRILEVMLQESQQPATNTMNGGTSRRRDEPITLRLLAHNNLVGRVIGRSGIVIKKIMEETNAKINVSQMTDPRERVIVIRGNLEEMSKAQQQITSKMRQCYEQDLQQAMMGGYGGPDLGPPPQQIPPALSYPFHRPPLPPPPPITHPYHGGPNGHHGGPHHPSSFGPPGGPYGRIGMSSPSGHFYPMGDGSVEVAHVWVPSCTVGAIIGTGGSSIREMIRASGCSIKVSQTNAKDEKKTKIDESVAKQNGSENPGDSPSSSSVATEGGHSTKRDGGSVASLPNPSDRRVTVTGSGEAQWKAQCLLYRKVFMEAVQHLDLNPDVSNDPQIQQGHLRIEINVPSNQVGRIIGRGGSTVKDMQRQSGAIIKLPEETSRRAGSPDEAVETPLYIIGDFYAVQAAQRRIRALIARTPPGGPTANGSHAKKHVEETATQKVEGECDQSESQC